MFFSFDSPETLYSVHRLTEIERRQAYTCGGPSLYGWVLPGVLAKLEAAGYGMTPRAHNIIRVTSGDVDVDAQWRRARHATRDRMRLVYAEEARWHADRLKRIEEEEAERRREAELRDEEKERAELAEELKHIVFVL